MNSAMFAKHKPCMNAACGDRMALSLVFVCASVLLLVWLACGVIDEYFRQREAELGEMRRFGEAFIREFERPLRQPPFLESPLRTRIDASPERGSVQVFLAPNGTRRYPNLSDHRTNTMYDVTRVLGTLPNHRFVCRTLSARGEWVVIRFQRRRLEIARRTGVS
jgi:hypothetical protein